MNLLAHLGDEGMAQGEIKGKRAAITAWPVRPLPVSLARSGGDAIATPPLDEAAISSKTTTR